MGGNVIILKPILKIVVKGREEGSVSQLRKSRVIEEDEYY
jgi:hypothetical protein